MVQNDCELHQVSVSDQSCECRVPGNRIWWDAGWLLAVFSSFSPRFQSRLGQRSRRQPVLESVRTWRWDHGFGPESPSFALCHQCDRGQVTWPWFFCHGVSFWVICIVESSSSQIFSSAFCLWPVHGATRSCRGRWEIVSLFSVLMVRCPAKNVGVFLLKKEEWLLGDTSRFCHASELAATPLSHEGGCGAGLARSGSNRGSFRREMGKVKCERWFLPNAWETAPFGVVTGETGVLLLLTFTQ